MRVGVTWQIAGVQRDAAPSHALHVRHLRSFVDARGMMNFLFQDRENPCGGWVARSPRANTRPRDADTVTIYVCHLLGGAGHDQQGSLRRTLGLPDILAGFQLHGFWRHSRALGKGLGRYDERPKNKQAGSEDEKGGEGVATHL